MKKSLLIAFMATVMFCGVAFMGTGAHFGTVQAATSVSGVIGSDTTWTKANSPYSLTGSVTIKSGVTLTIEPGVTLDLLGVEDDYPVGYDITVEGTLVARGSNTEAILFDGGSITFEQNSNNWDEQTGSGCIIENALLNPSIAVFINSSSPKIHKCSINGNINIYGGSPVISNNTIIPEYSSYYIQIYDGTPSILNNIINCHLRISHGSPVISNNTITLTNSPYEEPISATADSPVISYNIITSTTKIAVKINSGSPTISNNIITGGNDVGISLLASPLAPNHAFVSGNLIADCKVAGIDVQGVSSQDGWYKATIERNLIINNQNGIRISSSAESTVRENTITNNYNGLSFIGGEGHGGKTRSTFLNNNIYANTNYNVELQRDKPYEYDVDVTYNWWGTTDTQSISLTIFDAEDDSNLGTVNFVPFLTKPNPEAPTATYVPTTTPPPTDSPTPTPTTTPTPPQEPQQTDQFESIVGAAITVVVIGAGLGLLIYLIKRK